MLFFLCCFASVYFYYTLCIFFLKCINGVWFYQFEIRIWNTLVQKLSYEYTFIEIQFTDDLITFKFTLHALLNICKSVTSIVIFFFEFCCLLCDEYLDITITNFYVRSENGKRKQEFKRNNIIYDKRWNWNYICYICYHIFTFIIKS